MDPQKKVEEALAVFLLLEIENEFLALVCYDSDGFVLEEVPVDVNYLDRRQWNYQRLHLVRSIHDRQHLKAQRLLEPVAIVLLQKHEAGVLAFDCDPLDDLLDLVEVSRQLLSPLLSLIDFFYLVLVGRFSLLQKIEVLFLHLENVVLNHLVFGHELIAQSLRFGQLL